MKFYDVTGYKTHIVGIPYKSRRKSFMGTTTLCGIKYNTKGVRNLEALWVRTDGNCKHCHKIMKHIIKYSCSYCDKILYTKPIIYNNHNFCSNSCSFNYRWDDKD